MKKIAVLLAVSMLLCLCACGQNTPAAGEEDTSATEVENSASLYEGTLNVGVLKGPTGLSAVWLMGQDQAGNLACDLSFTVESTPTNLAPQVISGNLDVAFVPTNLAATISGRTSGGVRVIAVSALGVLHVMEKGDTIKSFADLNGKKVLASGQGTTAEFAVRQLIAKAGIDVDITFTADHTEAVSLALTGDYDAVILPEPFVTSLKGKNAGYHAVLDLSDAWEEYGLGELAMGCIIASKELCDNNPALIDYFLTVYQASADFANNSVADAAALAENYGVMEAAVAQQAMPNCNIVCVTGAEMKTMLGSIFNLMKDYDASLIGGAVPGNEFYYGA